MDPFREWADLYKVLGDKTRLHLLALLAKGPRCVCELVDVLGVSQPTVSHHLSRMRQLGLLQERRRGQWVFYTLVEDRLPCFHSLLESLPDVTDELIALDANMALACHVSNDSPNKG